MGSTEVVVGRIGKPHGVNGELSVEPRTDEPDRRFAAGAVLTTQTPAGATPQGPGRPGKLTVRAMRWHQSRLLVTFDEVADRTQAEAVRGLVLVTNVGEHERPEDPEEYYDHQLVGLRVFTADDEPPVGQVTGIVHSTAQDVLSVRTDDGREVLVPFVAQLVPLVDVPGNRVVVADRPGLFGPPDEEGGA
jgi:16S rRNA processing protein RimM